MSVTRSAAICGRGPIVSDCTGIWIRSTKECATAFWTRLPWAKNTMYAAVYDRQQALAETAGLRQAGTMKVGTIGAVLLFALGPYVLAQEAREPIIDVHLHTHPANRFGTVGVPNPVTGRPSAAMTDQALLDAALAQMRRYNIVAAVGFSDRQSVERWRSAAGGRIIGGMQIDQGIPGTPV